MRILKQAQLGLLLVTIFALAWIRMAARILPATRAASSVEHNGIRQGFMVWGAESGARSYALQATGTFPFIRVVPVMPASPVPVPVEIASLSAAGTNVGKSGHYALQQKGKSGSVDPFCVILSSDCGPTACGPTGGGGSTSTCP